MPINSLSKSIFAMMLFTLAISYGVQAEERSADVVYKEACSKCHGWIGSMMGDAPRTGNEEVWQTLQTKGLDELVKNTINGFGEMPAKGNCVDCSDAEIKAAVELILERSL